MQTFLLESTPASDFAVMKEIHPLSQPNTIETSARISTQTPKNSNLAKIFIFEYFFKKIETKNEPQVKTPNLQ